MGGASENHSHSPTNLPIQAFFMPQNTAEARGMEGKTRNKRCTWKVELKGINN